MDTADLQEYLEIVVDLEKNIDMQARIIEDLEWQIQKLAIPSQFSMPVPPTPPKGEKTPNFLIVGLIAGVVTIFVLGLPLAIIGSIFDDFAPYVDVICFTAGGIVFLLSLVLGIGSDADERKKYNKDMKQYELDCTEYQHAIDNDKRRVMREGRKKSFLENNLILLQERKNGSASTLSKAYALDIIYPKYRNLPMICSIYEYICSERCATLGGAYNILEEEIRLDRVILQLDRIIQILGEIKETQYILYNAINEGNRQRAQILEEIEQMSSKINNIDFDRKDLNHQLEMLQKDSALTAYNTTRIEKELSYMNRMNYFAGKYDNAGMFRRRPPM